MENIGHPLPLHERYGHTKRKLILKIRVGTYKSTWNGMKIPHIGRYVITHKYRGSQQFLRVEYSTKIY
jgi:hypothetical protein